MTGTRVRQLARIFFALIPASGWSRRLGHGFLALSHAAAGRERQIEARRERTVHPVIRSSVEREALERHVLERRPPWSQVEIRRPDIPHMISDEERRYYEYLGRFFGGFGEVLELGPWLGASTVHILAGLDRNPAFAGKRLQVFDDFIWRGWMDPHVEAPRVRPAPGASFRSLFAQNMGDRLDRMEVFERKFMPYEGNDSVPDFSWDGRPVEMCFIDCGRTFEVNRAWFSVLERSLIPDRTLLVLQDWHTAEQVPPRWYNQIKMFTDSLGSRLSLVHELRHGGAATFLFKG